MLEFIYNTESGQYYVCIKGQRQNRCLYSDNSGKYYYKNKGLVYLTEEETERLNNFIDKT